LRARSRSDRYPLTGLPTAKQTIITEHTAAAVVVGTPYRTLRNGTPHRPANERMPPTNPPCARKISHVFRYRKMSLKPAMSCSSGTWVADCTLAEAWL